MSSNVCIIEKLEEVVKIRDWELKISLGLYGSQKKLFLKLIFLFSKYKLGTLRTLGTSGTFFQIVILFQNQHQEPQELWELLELLLKLFFLFSKYKLGTLGTLGTSGTFFQIVIYYQNQDQDP